MKVFSVGDQVRIDIPDKSDPDFDRFHGQTGEVVEVIEDEVAVTTGDDRDAVLFRVSIDGGQLRDIRWRDLRPSSGSEDD